MSKKILLIFGALSGLILFTACGSGDKDVDVESVLPEDASVVFVLDYSNDEQVAKLENLLDQFPETGLGEKLLAEIDANTEAGDPSYEEIKPILEGEWKIALAMNFDENISFLEDLQANSLGSLEASATETPEIYFAGKFSEADKIEDLIAIYGEGLEYEEVDDAKYWTNKQEDVYAGRYGDIFFISAREEDREAILDRLKSGKVEFEPQAGSLTESNMGYMFLDFDRLGPLLGELYASIGFSTIADYFSAMGDVYVTWLVTDDGIKFVSNTKISDANLALVVNPDYKVSLVENVPAEGVFFYTEHSGLGTNLEAIMEGFLFGYNGGVYEEKEVDFSEDGKAYQEFLSDMADATDMEVSEAESLLNSPFALVASDVGTYYPTMGLYVKLNEGSGDAAKKLTNALDGYVDDMIVEFDTLLEEEGGDGVGALKRDVELVGGGGLHKVYLDWSVFSEESLAQFNGFLFNGFPGLDITKIKVEFYYGVTGDNVMVIALYPDFAAAYNSEALAGDEIYSEATAKLGENYGYMVSYFRTQPLIDLFTRYFDIGTSLGFIPESDKKEYDLYVKRLVGTFKYFIGSAKLDGENLRSDAFVKIEEVEER